MRTHFQPGVGLPAGPEGSTWCRGQALLASSVLLDLGSSGLALWHAGARTLWREPEPAELPLGQGPSIHTEPTLSPTAAASASSSSPAGQQRAGQQVDLPVLTGAFKQRPNTQVSGNERTQRAG